MHLLLWAVSFLSHQRVPECFTIDYEKKMLHKHRVANVLYQNYKFIQLIDTYQC